MPAKKTIKEIKEESAEPKPAVKSPEEERRAAGWPSSKDLGTWHKGQRTAQ